MINKRIKKKREDAKKMKIDKYTIERKFTDNGRVYHQFENLIGFETVSIKSLIEHMNDNSIVDQTAMFEELIACKSGQSTAEHCLVEHDGTILDDKIRRHFNYNLHSEIRSHSGVYRENFLIIGHKIKFRYAVSTTRNSDGGCTVHHRLDCQFSGDERFVQSNDGIIGIMSFDEFIEDKSEASSSLKGLIQKFGDDQYNLTETCLRVLKDGNVPKIDLSSVTEEEIEQLSKDHKFVNRSVTEFVCEKSSLSPSALNRIFVEEVFGNNFFDLSTFSRSLSVDVEVPFEKFKQCYETDEDIEKSLKNDKERNEQSAKVLDDLLPKIEQELRSKFKGDIDEIIGIIEDEDFSKSFEEGSDLYEIDFVHESLAEKDKVIPTVADMGGILLHFRHSYDVDAKTYYFKSYATYDTGQYGSEIDEITDLDADDPFNLTTTKLANESEDCTLADHDIFLDLLEERTGEAFREGFEVHEALSKLKEEDDEEAYVELNDAITECSRAAVKLLGVLNFIRDLKDFAIEFNIQL